MLPLEPRALCNRCLIGSEFLVDHFLRSTDLTWGLCTSRLQEAFGLYGITKTKWMTKLDRRFLTFSISKPVAYSEAIPVGWA